MWGHACADFPSGFGAVVQAKELQDLELGPGGIIVLLGDLGQTRSLNATLQVLCFV